MKDEMKRKIVLVVLIMAAFVGWGQQKSTVKIGLFKYN
jgi:hypothetical protein